MHCQINLHKLVSKNPYGDRSAQSGIGKGFILSIDRAIENLHVHECFYDVIASTLHFRISVVSSDASLGPASRACIQPAYHGKIKLNQFCERT
jgi:hypothetical protein